MTTTFRRSVSKVVNFNVGDRVFYVGTGRKGTITTLHEDLAMVRWDERTHNSPDPMAYDQIAPIPKGWDEID